MPLKIDIPSKFILNQIRTINNTNWLTLPFIDLIHESDDPANVITINDIDCIVTGRHLEIKNQIYEAYRKSFNNYPKPFNLDSLLRFSPYCSLSQSSLNNAEYFLGITVDYIEINNSVTFQKKEKKNCRLFYKKKAEEDEMPKHEGWIAIDFGTSNSTVTFYDPKEGTYPNELPLEQKNRLLALLQNWLGSPSSFLPGVGENEWNQFIEQVNRRLKQPWSTILNDDKSSSSLLEGIRQLEIALATRPQDDPLYLAVSEKLNEVYHEVFMQPPLQKERIVLAELDKNKPGENQIISELELVNVNGFLEVEMGLTAQKNRLEVISQNNQDDQEKNWEEITARFHHSPKRYLNKNEEEFNIDWDKKLRKFAYSELIQAAFKRLINLAEEFKDNEKNRKRCSIGSFYRAIVTYPTVTRPEVRRQLEDLVRQILEQKFADTGIEVDVKRDFDEAIAAAIFYLWREFGGNHTIGLEAFKTRCRRMGQKWAQNVLVLDIGGGTTDLALIRLRLEEINPFEPGKDRGAGGRYYVLTPDLMGSSGHLHLGGEYITLQLFRLLKVALADSLLTAVTEGRLNNENLNELIRTLEKQFTSEDKYRSQSLLKCIDKENAESDPVFDTVLNYAERVLPTRWKADGKSLQGENLQAFYTLWEIAEDIKVKLSRGLVEYDLSQHPDYLNALISLLYQNDIELPEDYFPNIRISREQLERAATPIIEEAINLAKGLLESRLPLDELTSKKEPLDWLILSGQTCHLDLVTRKTNEIFSKSNFEWNPARITFVPEYAKLATSIGACYGISLQQRNLVPEEAIDKLKNGYSELYIQVKNLLYTLPCSFTRQLGEIEERIFSARQQLYQLKPNEEAKAQSSWFGVQPTITVRRLDFDNKRSEPWYNLVFENDIAKKIGIYSDSFEYYKPFKVQFEVNQTLEIGMLLCKGNPHYSFDKGCPGLKNLDKKLSEELKKQNIQEQIPKSLFVDGVLQWEIVVGIDEQSPHSVFKPENRLDEIFHYSENGKETDHKGALSKDIEGKPLPLPAFPRSGKHTFYAYYPSLTAPNPLFKPILLGVLGSEGNKTNENYRYYVTIDDQGDLCLHEGEIPYWISNDPEVLKQEGYVFRANPSPIKEDDNDKRNPFSGTH